MISNNKLRICFLFILITSTFGFKKDELRRPATASDKRISISNKSQNFAFNPSYTVEQIRVTVKQIIRDQMVVDDSEVVNSTSLVADLEADPLDILEITMAINEFFAINISEAEVENLETVGQWIEKVMTKVKPTVFVSQSIRNRVNTIIVEKYWLDDASSITDASSLHYGFLGGDELSYTELIMGIESEFMLEIPDEDWLWSPINTVAELYNYVAYRTM